VASTPVLPGESTTTCFCQHGTLASCGVCIKLSIKLCTVAHKQFCTMKLCGTLHIRNARCADTIPFRTCYISLELSFKEFSKSVSHAARCVRHLVQATTQLRNCGTAEMRGSLHVCKCRCAHTQPFQACNISLERSFQELSNGVSHAASCGACVKLCMIYCKLPRNCGTAEMRGSLHVCNCRCAHTLPFDACNTSLERSLKALSNGV
jgi:hypothetical protein